MLSAGSFASSGINFSHNIAFVTSDTVSCLSGSKTFTTITTPRSLIEYGLKSLRDCISILSSTKIFNSINFIQNYCRFIDCSIFFFNILNWSSTNKPYYCCFTVFIVLVPFSISIVSNACKNLQALGNSSISFYTWGR